MNNRRKFIIAFGAGVFTTPFGSFAQQPGKVWRVGFMSPGGASPSSPYADAFAKGMRELGYVEGKDLAIEWRFADGNLERLPGFAEELAQLKVDVIVAVGSPALSATQKATITIPIVMANAGDPVVGGFVKSLARPGGNITGLSNMGGDTGAKLLDLLRSTVPKVSRVAMLTPSRTYCAISLSVQAAAQKAGVKALVMEGSTPQEIDNAFALMVRDRADAVIVGSPTTFATRNRQIAELALKYHMPSMFQDRASVEAGGLMSYGTKTTDLYYRAATYVDKILKGAKPGELPVEQPVSFELVVNLRTSKALGLAIPQTILLRADEVIQ